RVQRPGGAAVIPRSRDSTGRSAQRRFGCLWSWIPKPNVGRVQSITAERRENVTIAGDNTAFSAVSSFPFTAPTTALETESGIRQRSLAVQKDRGTPAPRRIAIHNRGAEPMLTVEHAGKISEFGAVRELSEKLIIKVKLCALYQTIRVRKQQARAQTRRCS